MYKVGMYGGTFDSLHKGHINDIIIASTLCEKLYVILCYSKYSDRIDYHLRYKWLKDETKNIDNVIVLSLEDTNNNKEEYDWYKGRDNILKLINKKIDIVFCGDDYKDKNLFEKLYPNSKIYYIKRSIIDISSTKIINDPFKYYDYIPYSVRSYFNKKVLILGSESCGKTTIVKKLSQIYNTNYLDETGRYICEEYGGIDNIYDEGYLKILLSHKLKELELIKQSNKVLFIDTDALITKYYYLLGNNDNKDILNLSESIININSYDLIFFLEPDVKWVQDGTRTYGNKDIREKNNIFLKELLDKHNIKYITIKGNYNKRLNDILKYLKNNKINY